MTIRTAAAGRLSRFAHLVGGVSAKADEGDPKKDDDEDKDGEDKDKAAKEDEEGGGSGEGGGDDEDDKKSSKAKEGEDDDGDDSDDSDDKKSARLAERKRIARIFGSQAAAANMALAAELACGTGLPSKTAIDLLKAGAATASRSTRAGLGDRMAGVPAVRVGAGDAGANRGRRSDAELAKERAAAMLAKARASGMAV